jgi:hypothetical protein
MQILALLSKIAYSHLQCILALLSMTGGPHHVLPLQHALDYPNTLHAWRWLLICTLCIPKL